jgi:hypothetical protein
MTICNQPVKTLEGGHRQCLCVLGHAGGCNPFSTNPYMAVVIAKADLPKGDKMPLSAQPVGVIWTDQSTTRRCLWQGPHGRCIYELGNHTEHKEETHGNRDHQ